MSNRLTGMHGDRRLVLFLGLAVLLAALFLTAACPAGATANFFEQGLADLKAGRYRAAADKFTLAIEAVPDDYEALNNRGFARIYLGDYEGAITDCSRSIAINPGSAKAYNNRGFARLFIGEFEPAIADFNRALGINPRYVDAYSNRCLAWTRQGDYEQAVVDCSEALHLNPRSAKALYNRGYARDRQGNPGDAMRDYIQALQVNPGYIEVFNNMAWIMATSPVERLRDGRRAVAYAEKAVGHAADINFLDTLAAAYAESGRFDEAVAIENRIISLLAAAHRKDAIARHVQRMSLYEEGRAYREPIAVQSVSAVTDLEGELAALDKLVFAPEVSTVAYEPSEAAHNLTAQAAAQTAAPGQAPSAPAAAEGMLEAPVAYSQSVQTSPGFPVEISLAAEPEGVPLTFEIETVPYQGALQGTLPNLLYIPRPGFEGVDRFTFRAHNAAGLSNLATITITVAEPPPTPAAAPPEAAPAEPQAPEEGLPVEETLPQETAVPSAAPGAGPAVPADTSPAAENMPAPGVPSPETEPPAPPPPESAPAEEPPLPAETDAAAQETDSSSELAAEALYTIQVFSVKEAEAAAEIVANLTAEGYTAFSRVVEVPEKGQWHRVFINSYPSMAAVREGLDRLDAERFKGAFIRRMPNGVRLPAAAASTASEPAKAPAAPEPDVPAAAPAPEVNVPVSQPAAEPNTPATAPAPDVEIPAAAPAPETSVPAAAPAPASGVPAETPAEAAGERQAIPVAGETFPYAYQVQSYKQREDAFQLAVELTTQGHTAFIGRGTMGSTGVWYRVYIGCYQTPEEAEKSRLDITRAGFPDAFLTPVDFTIAIHPDASDPAGNNLESRLMASGFLPYRFPGEKGGGPPTILVGGFRSSEDAAQVLAALKQSGFAGEIRPR